MPGVNLTGLIPAPAAPTPGKVNLSGLLTPTNGSVSPDRIQDDAYQRAMQKLKTGGVLTAEEAAAMARVKSDQRAMAAIGAALQPLLAPSDVVKGVAQDVKDDITSGQPFTHTQGGNRGMATATAHLTYGLTERLPGFAGARAAGVTGEQLLKGTKYEGNGKAALLVELLSDPSLVLGGGGLVLKGAGMAGKYASLAEFASTASGANALRDMANVVNNAGSKLLHLSDAATGIPAAARIVGGSKVGQAVKAGVSKLADTTMPAPLQRAMGVRTYGDAFLTPDQKAAAYTAGQLERDAFRDSTRLGVDDLGSAITRSAVEDAKIVGDLTKGLGKADAAEVNRLYGVLGNTTDPAVATEVFRKLEVISTRTGRSLETPMVEAYKATDRISQQTLGHNLAARNLPAVLDPVVTKAVQQAQTGADLIPHIGGYKTAEGRPRGILMTQYQGRGDLDKVINKIEDAPPVAASVNLNDPALAPAATQKITGTLDRAAADLPELPPAPVAPVGVRPAAAAPTNPAETLDRILAEPGGVKPAASVSDAAAAPVPPAPVPRSPAEVMDELFGSKTATVGDAPPVSPANALGDVAPDAAAQAAVRLEGALPTLPEMDVANLQHIAYGNKGWGSFGPKSPEDIAAIRAAMPENVGVIEAKWGSQTQPIVFNRDVVGQRLAEMAADPQQGVWMRPYRGQPLDEVFGTMFKSMDGYGAGGRTEAEQMASDMIMGRALGVSPRAIDDYFKGTRTARPLPPSGSWTDFPEFSGIELQAPAPGYSYFDYPGNPNVAQAERFAASIERARTSGAAPATAAPDLTSGAALSGKTPAETLDAILNPARPQTGYATAPDLARTPQADLKAAANITTPTERLVSKAVPTTYRTVSIDPSALDWASLPDQAARRAVANVLGGEIVRTAEGGFKYSRDLAEVPLSHPVISHYFDDATLEAARFTGTGYGERVIAGRQQVPDWYDPKSGQPLDLQRAERDATLNGTPLNDLTQMERTANELNTGNLDSWIVGDAYASSGRPLITSDFPRAANDYSERVIALNGRPATPGELFAYKMRLARYNQEARLRTVTGEDITNHLTDYFGLHPEATLFDAVSSASKQFGLGRGGREHLQRILRDEESGFVQQMSSGEKASFAQYLKADQRSSIPGGSVASRMLRNPEAVSSQFKQVFEQEYNGMQLLSDQVQRGTNAILQAEQQTRYANYLKQTGQHYTAHQLVALNARPAHLLTAEEARILHEITYATESAGRVAGWKIMDRNYGVFKVGDAVPWWAYQDLFHASSVSDASVSGRILERGSGGFMQNFGENYDRFWADNNATMLSSPSSIVTDQIGQLMQMVMYGVTPDEIINGLIQRAVAKPAALDAMRESGGIASAKLESNLSVDGAQLRALARRLNEGEDNFNRVQRVVDQMLRFHDYGSGVDRAALSNPALKVASDVAHLGSAKLFQLRSAMSDLQREALYFHYLSTGKTPAQAGAAANEVLMDMRLAPAYAKVVGRYWPFFRWIAMSGPRSVVNILRKPSVSYAWNRAGPLSDEATDDGKNDARRLLSRPNSVLMGQTGNGWINLGAGLEERDHTRVYLDVRNWDPNSTVPQLLDWTGTKVGAVSLPWYGQLVVGLGWGVDRNGLPVYKDALNGAPGGLIAATQIDAAAARREAVLYTLGLFAPSYALGGTRAANMASAIVETAKLPDDGSKDITIAKTLMASPIGRDFVNVMQHGWGVLTGVPLTGNRGSAYSAGPPSMARAATGYLFPVQGIQVDQHQQGTAASALNVGLLNLQSWRNDEVNRIKNMMAGGADPVMVRAAQQQAMREYQRRAQLLNVTNLVTK